MTGAKLHNVIFFSIIRKLSEKENRFIENFNESIVCCRNKLQVFLFKTQCDLEKYFKNIFEIAYFFF